MESHKKITIKSYDKTVKEYIKKTESLHPESESKVFLSCLNKNSLILDLGCGYGRDAKIFFDKGYNVIGVDLSEKMIEAAKKRVKNVEFKVMGMLNLDFKNNLFDGIWANASFLHIPNKGMATAIKECHRVLKDKGILYLSVKEGKGEGISSDERYGGVKKFWTYFQKSEIENLLVDSGFNIIKSYVELGKGDYYTHPFICIFARK